MKQFYIIFFLFLFSCNQLEEGVDDEKIIVVDNSYGTHLITNYDIVFSAKDMSGNDISSKVTFYIDDKPQTGNVINFSQSGSYIVTAKMQLEGQEITSVPYQVEVEEAQNTKKILIEDYTGTWCTNCPRAVYYLEQAISQNDNIIPVAIHLSRFSGDDPFGFKDFHIIAQDYKVSALPTTIINRLHDTKGRWDMRYISLDNFLKSVAPLGLKVESSNKDGKLAVTVSLKFSMDMKKQQLNLVIYLIENDLIADQENATSFYGGQNPIPDFEQKYVLREALNGLYGTAINNTNAVAGNIISQYFEFNIPDNIININNCDIIAFVINKSEGKRVLNIQKARINTIQDFD